MDNSILITVYYDDYFVPQLLQAVTDLFNDRPQWEHEIVIAAEALYAETFLCVN